MTALGINSDAHGSYSASELADLGARWVRVVALPDMDLTEWLIGCQEHGIKVLLTLASESFDPAMAWSDNISRYKARYGPLVSAWQCGNESDHKSPSSWTLSRGEFVTLIHAARRALGNVWLVGPGLVSGQPSYLDGIELSVLDAIAVHPYGRAPGDPKDWPTLPGNFGSIAELVDAYRHFGKPIWLTEFGVSTKQVSEAFQARYVEAALTWAKAQNNIGPAFLFTYHAYDGFGLLRADGARKAAWDAFHRVAAAPTEEPLPVPPVVPPTTPERTPFMDLPADVLRDLWFAVRDETELAYEPSFAIPRAWSRDPLRYGSPLGNEHDGYQAFTKAVAHYLGGDDVEWFEAA